MYIRLNWPNSLNQRFKRLYQSAWLVWGLGAGFFFCEYLARIAPAVMTAQLMSAFSVSCYTLGVLSSYFYVSYLGMQLPVGMLVDRFGPHRLLTLMAGLCGVSTLLFAHAHYLWMAELSRFILGFASAFVFVGALKLAAVWFSPERFGLLAGLTQAIGMVGASVADAPLAKMVQAFGWRQALIYVALIFTVLAVFIGTFVRDVPHAFRGKRSEIYQKTSVLIGLWEVLKNPQSWINAFYVSMVYGSTALFAELWGVTAITYMHHVSVPQAAGAVGFIFIGWGIGGPLFGWLSDYFRRRKFFMYLSPVAGFITMALVLYRPHLSLAALSIILLIYGITNAGVSISYALSAEINRRHLSGTSMAFCNLASVIVGACFQPFVGKCLDILSNQRVFHGKHLYIAHDFQTALSVMLVFFVLAFISAFFIRETYCKSVSE